MEILQEGLHTYQVKEEVKNAYYLSVEYGVLKRNSIRMLLPVQLREQDGRQRILFDITGKQSLKEFRREQGISFQESRKLVQGLVSLIQEIDDYMLNFECVNLCPEYTFVEDSSKFQWMYLPDDKNDVQKAAEDFFSWMLTRMDYENARGIMFAYAVFDAVRKHGFSGQLLEKCLERFPEDYGREKCITEDSPEDYEREVGVAEGFPVWGDGTQREKEEVMQGGFQDQRGGKDRKEGEDLQSSFPEKKSKGDRKGEAGILLRRGMAVMQVIFLILSAGAAVSVGTLAFGGVRYGFSLMRYRYIAGCSILAIVFLTMAYQFWKKRRKISGHENQGQDTGRRSRSRRGMTGDSGKDLGTQKRSAEWELRDGEWELPEKSEWAWENDAYEQERKEREKENVPKKDKWMWAENMTEDDMEEAEEETVVLGVRRQALYPMLREKETGLIHTVDSVPFYIGSGKEGNQMRVRSCTVSRRHAVILAGNQTGKYVIQDLDSTNGTWADGVKLEGKRKCLLKDGMILRFAQCEYEFLQRE